MRPAPSHPAPGPHTGCPKFSVFRNLGSIFLKTKVLTIEPSLQRFENRQFPPNTPGGSGGVHLGPSRRDRVRIATGETRGQPAHEAFASWRDAVNPHNQPVRASREPLPHRKCHFAPPAGGRPGGTG